MEMKQQVLVNCPRMIKKEEIVCGAFNQINRLYMLCGN